MMENTPVRMSDRMMRTTRTFMPVANEGLEVNRNLFRINFDFGRPSPKPNLTKPKPESKGITHTHTHTPFG